jgi:hypothetical protein
MSSRTFRWPAKMFVVAVALYFFPALLAVWRNVQPLALELPLEPGVTVSPDFRVSQTLPYLVELEVDRSLPFEQLTCLLGEPLSSATCNETGQIVDLQWRVSSRGNEVARGQSAFKQGAGFGPTIEKTLGSFNGRAWQQYRLEVTVLRSIRALEVTRPRILVQLHPIHTKGDFLVSVLMQWLATLVAAVALVWLGVAWTRQSTRNRVAGHREA